MCHSGAVVRLYVHAAMNDIENATDTGDPRLLNSMLWPEPGPLNGRSYPHACCRTWNLCLKPSRSAMLQKGSCCGQTKRTKLGTLEATRAGVRVDRHHDATKLARSSTIDSGSKD